TIGSDLHCRMRMAMKSYGGWTSVTFAPFGVVAAGGKLMGFDEQHMLHGMGIAYAQCSGNQQANVDGALTVRLQQGLGAKAGMLALALAERGITGATNVLQGKYGFYPLYTKAEGDMALLTDGLGRRFEVENISVKAYPCCAYTHEPIEGTLQLMKENCLEADDVAEIVVRANSKAYNLCVYSEEGDTKYVPRNTVDAQFSIPYTVAAAAVRGSVGLGDFSEEAISDAAVLRLARRVKVEVDPELDRIPGSVVPNVIEVRMGDGGKYSRRVEFAKGHPGNPMTMSECADKFRECARFAVRRLPDRNIERVIDMAGRLEETEDVTEIVRLLTPGRRSA
ncbi:MAG: MmgE/PrpD family protein, partial [Chloroflexota bacterium]